MKLKYIITVLILLISLCQIASAAITNPSFESGLTGWNGNSGLISSSWSTDGSNSLLLSGTGVSAMRYQTVDLTDVDYVKVDVHYRKIDGLYSIACRVTVYNTNFQEVRLVNANNRESTTFTDETLIVNTKDLNGNYIIALVGGGSKGAGWISTGEAYFDNVVLIMNSSSPSYPQSNGKIYFTNDPYAPEDVANINIITNYSYNNLGWKWESIVDSNYSHEQLGRTFIDSLLGEGCVFYKTCIVVDTDAGNYTTGFSKTQDIGLELIQETSDSITMFNYPISNSTDNVLRTRYLETTWVYTGYSARLKALAESGYFDLFGYIQIGDFLAENIELTPVLSFSKTIDTDYAYHRNENNIEIIELKDNLYDYINTSVTNMTELINNTVNKSYFNNTPLENITKILENTSNNNFYNITNVTYLTNESVQHLTITNTTTHVSQFFNNTSVTQQFFNNTTQVIQYLNNRTYITVTNGSGYNYTPDIVMNSSFMQGYKETIDNSLGNLMKLLYDFVSIIIYPLSKMSEALTSLSGFLYEMLPKFELWNVLIPPIFDYLPQSVINTLGLGLILAIILEILER